MNEVTVGASGAWLVIWLLGAPMVFAVIELMRTPSARDRAR